MATDIDSLALELVEDELRLGIGTKGLSVHSHYQGGLCSHCTAKHRFSFAHSPLDTTTDTFSTSYPLSPPSFSWSRR
ncbi:hypothetical protein [Absidia glauca]|uniref:Uncharacterized protein n=1 Tax=Absidia glauca TaxID=4829 RepID=A0A168R555_ABSGL|nr:hypothetical protein [Absidia glauca]